MLGLNRAVSKTILGKSANSVACVFVSYRSVDRQMATEIDIAIRKTGIDTYFDASDSQLQSATATGDAPRVVQQIDKGLSASSHLLGIISERTKGSWWVPYEIGWARHATKSTSHLIAGDVKEIPAFIQASNLLLDLDAFSTWLESVGPRPLHASASLKKSMPNLSIPNLPSFRIATQIRFTHS